MKFAVLGAAGGIGQPLSLLLKTRLPAGSRLSLYDIVPSIPGVAMDVSHIPTPVDVEGYCADDIDKALSGADVVLISAGLARKPGMTRADLLTKNADIVVRLVRSAAKFCPDACVAIITNPVNTLVPLAARVLEAAGCYNPKKLFGVTLLDALRAETFVCRSQRLLDPSNLFISVIGGHSDTTMLPLFSHVNGVEMTEEIMDDLVAKVRKGGTFVVDAKAGAGSATLSMAAAAARFSLVIARGMLGDPLAVSSAFVDHAVCDTRFFAQPLRFGKDGIAEYLPIGPLDSREKRALEEILPLLRKDIAVAYDMPV